MKLETGATQKMARVLAELVDFTVSKIVTTKKLGPAVKQEFRDIAWKRIKDLHKAANGPDAHKRRLWVSILQTVAPISER